MRYCLSCRGFSGDGPLCTQCGRSFGGRLCNGRKRHLNPPDAQFCGECGTNSLMDAASFVPLGCSGRLVAWGAAVGLLWWGATYLFGGAGQGFARLTGYGSPAIWLIEKSASVLIVLFVFYFLSAFIPGEAGKQFRDLMAKLCLELLRVGLRVVQRLISSLGRLVFKSGKEKKTRS